MANKDKDRMPDLAFRAMAVTMALIDFLFPHIDKRVEGFDIHKGMTVVDYGCGPGRYTTRFAKLVGEQGKVYAVDVQELALQYVRRRIRDQGVSNVVLVRARNYQTDIPDNAANMVFALDMIFSVKEPAKLLGELHRIVRPDGVLVVDDGHQSREKTVQMVEGSGKWAIEKQSRDHLLCMPVGKSAA